MMEDPEPKALARAVQAQQLAVRSLLNKWDPVGLIEMGAPETEYSDLVMPVLQALWAGGREKQVARAVGEVIRRDYELKFGRWEGRRQARTIVEWYDANGRALP